MSAVIKMTASTDGANAVFKIFTALSELSERADIISTTSGALPL